uniref:Uncharacterized protein n=1 Tax=Anopheles maculatus TaxID=74869 RepID=A0A182T7L8_9DIPT
MEEEQTQIVSVTLKDIFHQAFPSPADLLPWYIPKCFWRSLLATRQLAACENVPLHRPDADDADRYCPAQPTRDVLLQCGIALARLHQVQHVFIVSRNGGTVRRLLQLMKENATELLYVLVLTDRISTVEEFQAVDNVRLVRYGRAALEDDGPTSNLPACYGIASDEHILHQGRNHPNHTLPGSEALYEEKLLKLFQSARLVLEQMRPEARWNGLDGQVLYLYRSFPEATFVNCFKIKRLR